MRRDEATKDRDTQSGQWPLAVILSVAMICITIIVTAIMSMTAAC